MSTRTKINVKLMGGLGNQLFILSFAHLLAHHRPELNVEVDLSEMNKQSHSSSALHLDLSSLFADYSSRVAFKRRSYLFERAKEVAHITRSEEITEVGFSIDPVTHQFASHSLRGYFQSYEYIKCLKEAGAPLKIKLAKSLQESFGALPTVTQSQFATVHARLGDYRGLSDSFGLLGRRYFERAVRELYANGARLFFLLSDEPDWWDGFKPSLPTAEFHIVRNLSPETQLYFMSTASYSVLSNSTYALWGAIAGREKKLIVAPNKWFRGMSDPSKLLSGLPNLIQINPEWT